MAIIEGGGENILYTKKFKQNTNSIFFSFFKKKGKENFQNALFIIYWEKSPGGGAKNWKEGQCRQFFKKAEDSYTCMYQYFFTQA